MAFKTVVLNEPQFWSTVLFDGIPVKNDSSKVFKSFRILSHSALLNSWIFLGFFALMVAFSDVSAITRWS